jgi:two-component system chemotaxis sensor kinase CheA
MSSGIDDDIRNDFLTEAGELIERLGGQLMELERRPQDSELLNAVFRAFHTVKGGAGFLGLTALVDLCHVTEDVCNTLRNGQVQADALMLDCLLQSLDQVQRMMEAVSRGETPTAAPEDLIDALRTLSASAAAKPAPAVVAEPVKPVLSQAAAETISEDEFEALLDQLQGKKGDGKREAGDVSSPASTLAPTSSAEAAKADVDAERPRSPSPASHLPSPVPAAPPAETQVRVDTQKLDRMMNLIGELVLVRNRLKSLRQRSASDPVSRSIGELDFITRALQGAVMQIRMQPVKRVFSRFPKLARDVARGLGKQVEVELQGEDTDLDKNLVEALADPLVHMVRNSVDHGIELPETRLRAGKPAAGRLTLSAQQEGDHILITVRDDGAGIDPERLREKALQKGLLDAASASRLTPEECLDLIFLPGFSTKEQVSDLSGRGVGMDVVRSRIKELNGSVSIDSRIGQGTTFRIRVPLTLAILSALMVQAGERQYALPLAPVRDVFALDQEAIRKLDRWDVVMTRQEALRLVHLDPWLSPQAAGGPRHVVVAQVGEERYGFVVREVRGREEIVIKPLGASLRGLAGVAGATVMPDGHVALILDLTGLVQAYRASLGQAETSHG